MAEIAALLQRHNIDGLIQETIYDAQSCHHEEVLMRRKPDTHMFLLRTDGKLESWYDWKEVFHFAPYEANTDFSTLIKTIQDFC